MRLSEITGVDAIDVIADIIDPVTVIMADKEIEKVIKGKQPYIIIARTILKRQKVAIMEILAILNQTDPQEFKPSLIELPVMLLQLVQDIMENEELMSLFHLQGQKTASVSSIPVTDNTEGTETM